MASINFLLQSKSEKCQIYIRLSYARGVSPKRKTGLYIDYKDWSNKTKLPKQTSANNKNISTDLQDLEKYVFKRLNLSNSKGIEINGEWLQETVDLHFGRITENKQSELITDSIQDIIKNANTRKNSKGGLGLSKSRINSYNSLDNIIKEYQGKQKHKIKEVDLKYAKKFLQWLLNTKGYSESYATKKIADLKTVCFDAETNGIEIHHQLKKISHTKKTNENIIYLSTSELEKIEKIKLNSDALNNAKKWLLLGCNIGQRGSDLLNINESNFINRGGLQVIELTQQKTNKNVTIPLLETTKKILETGLPYKISIQKFNEYIKTVCKEAGINSMTYGGIVQVTEKGKGTTQKRKVYGDYEKWMLIGSHVCRRSFASNLYGIIPTPLIMSITAHGTEKMLLNYIGKQGLDYAQQIADFYRIQELKSKDIPVLTVIKKAL